MKTIFSSKNNAVSLEVLAQEEAPFSEGLICLRNVTDGSPIFSFPTNDIAHSRALAMRCIDEMLFDNEDCATRIIEAFVAIFGQDFFKTRTKFDAPHQPTEVSV